MHSPVLRAVHGTPATSGPLFGSPGVDSVMASGDVVGKTPLGTLGDTLFSRIVCIEAARIPHTFSNFPAYVCEEHVQSRRVW
jgi:hypothetical protein